MAVPNKTPGNIMNSIPIESNSLLYSFFIGLLYVGLVFLITMCFTFNTFPLRYSMISLFHGSIAAENSVKENSTSKKGKYLYHLYTIIILVGVLIIAFNVEQLNLLFQLLGGSTSAFINFVVPPIYIIYFYHNKTTKERISFKYYIYSYFLIVFGVVGGIWSIYVTIIENF